MDYNGLSIVSPQHYPDGKEWNNLFNLWLQDYDINTNITERFHYLISHSDYLVMVQRPLNNDNSDYEIISVSNEDQQSYLPAFTNIKEITDYIDLPEPQEGYQVEVMVASYKRLLEEIYMRTEGLNGLVINPFSQKLIANEKLLNSIGHNTTTGINHQEDLPSLVPANLKFRKNMKIYHSNGKDPHVKELLKESVEDLMEDGVFACPVLVNKKDLYTNKTGELALHTGADIYIKPLMCFHADPNKLYISLFTGLNDIKRMNLDHDEPDMEMIITCQSFESYKDVLFSSDAFCGILINPFTDHLGFSKDMLDEMFYNKETIN